MKKTIKRIQRAADRTIEVLRKALLEVTEANIKATFAHIDAKNDAEVAYLVFKADKANAEKSFEVVSKAYADARQAHFDVLEVFNQTYKDVEYQVSATRQAVNETNVALNDVKAKMHALQAVQS